MLTTQGVAATIEAWLLAAEYILAEGNQDVVSCERGVRGIDTTLRNQLDLSAVPLLRELAHLPATMPRPAGIRAKCQPFHLKCGENATAAVRW